MSQRGYLLNATGCELPNDMACPSTIEPFKLDKDAEEFFYDEFNTLPLSERVDRIVGVFERNKQLVADLIVENNHLGRALMHRLPGEQFVVSVKRPGSTMHWMYTIVDRMKPVPDEWLKDLIEEDKGVEHDFFNVWTGQGKVDQGDPNYQPMAEIVNPPPRPFNGSSQMDTGIEDVSRQGVSVNVGALPTDEDFKGLDALTKDGILDQNLQVEADPMEMMRQQAVLAKIEAAQMAVREELGDKIFQLQNALGRARRVQGNLADEIFDVIKHGDEKHQAWLKHALQAFFSGRPPMTEEELTELNEAIAHANTTGKQKFNHVLNAAPPVSMLGTEDRSAVGMRLPTNVQWVDEQGKPKP